MKSELQSYQTALDDIKGDITNISKHLNNKQKVQNNIDDGDNTNIQEIKAELRRIKENIMDIQRETATNSGSEELLVIQKQLSQIQSQLSRQGLSVTEIEELKNSIIQPILESFAKLADEILLVSPVTGTDYRKLKKLLHSGNWQEADQETSRLMCRISNRERDGLRWLDRGEIEHFPWQDLRIINRIWVEYSNGKFGFTVQKQIWQSIKIDQEDDFALEKSLGDRVGWRVNNNWLKYDDFTFDLNAPDGHLPSTTHLVKVNIGRVEDRIRFFLSRQDLQP